MTVATIVPHAAPSADSDPTAAELASLARELCAAEGLCWSVALAKAAHDLDPLATFAHQWDRDADWLHLQADWGLDDMDELPFVRHASRNTKVALMQRTEDQTSMLM